MERSLPGLDLVSGRLLSPQEILAANGGSFEDYSRFGTPILPNIYERVYHLTDLDKGLASLYKRALTLYWKDYPSNQELLYFRKIRELRARNHNLWKQLATETGLRPIPYFATYIRHGENVLLEDIGKQDEHPFIRIYHDGGLITVEEFTPRRADLSRPISRVS